MNIILPEIQFRYSDIYDEKLRVWEEAPSKKQQLSSRQVEAYMKAVEANKYVRFLVKHVI